MKSMEHEYKGVLRKIFTDMRIRDGTIETFGVTFRTAAAAAMVRKGVSPSLGVIEALQMITADYDHADLVAAAPKADPTLFREDMSYAHPDIAVQWLGALKELDQSPESRRAQIVMPKTGERARCVLSISFLRRDHYLDAYIHMRALDMWKGIPYDQTMFGSLVQISAQALRCVPGTLTWMVDTAHLYNEDTPAADHFLTKTRMALRHLQVMDLPFNEHLQKARDELRRYRTLKRQYPKLIEQIKVTKHL